MRFQDISHEGPARVLKRPISMGGRKPLASGALVLPSEAPLGSRLRRKSTRTTAPRLTLASTERPPEETALERSLVDQLPAGRGIHLRLTDNRYTMVMVRRGVKEYRVRLHRMFAAAEPRLIRSLARYIVHNDQRASAVIGAFIDRNQHTIRQQPQRPRKVVLRTAGLVHDLKKVFDRLNQEYFEGSLEARITWGPAPRRTRPRRSIKMGSFAVEDRIIRIHPLLDDTKVPEYFVAWVCFHEMLHGKHGVEKRGNRRCFHSKAFSEEEKTFRDYHRACAWEQENRNRLLGG